MLATRRWTWKRACELSGKSSSSSPSSPSSPPPPPPLPPPSSPSMALSSAAAHTGVEVKFSAQDDVSGARVCGWAVRPRHIKHKHGTDGAGSTMCGNARVVAPTMRRTARTLLLVVAVALAADASCPTSPKTRTRQDALVFSASLDSPPGSTAYPVPLRVHTVFKGQRHVRNAKVLLSRSDCNGRLEVGRNYIFFVHHKPSRDGKQVVVRVHEPPMLATQEKVNEVWAGLSSRRKFAAPKLKVEPKNTTVQLQQPLMLRCKFSGIPPPQITWYKDGRSVKPNLRNNLKSRRANNTLRRPAVKPKDAGRYECRAENSMGKAIGTAYVSVNRKKHPKPITTPHVPPEVPPTTLPPPKVVLADCKMTTEFCLNGGICELIEPLRELSCKCATGFKGVRCEEKDVDLSNMDASGTGTRELSLYWGK